jgi:hypothetical protein
MDEAETKYRVLQGETKLAELYAEYLRSLSGGDENKIKSAKDSYNINASLFSHTLEMLGCGKRLEYIHD